MTITRLLASLVALIAFVPAYAKDGDKIAIRGMPISVAPATDDEKKAGIVGTMLVEGAKAKDTEYDKAFIKITKATKIFMMSGKDLKPAKFEDLKGGQKMEVQFVGPVAESFPVQATAGKIVIFPR
ncbi:MAG: DUF3221 domain-containing protein [Gemmataceae bacterium]|nr:DUF3221 domain-containing protein [Gemmataceae bacterium]